MTPSLFLSSQFSRLVARLACATGALLGAAVSAFAAASATSSGGSPAVTSGTIATLAATADAPKKVPAFPGAEGFGAYTTGGRGGEVYHVTNLDDSGPGSFRDAVSKPNRTVVFDVGGVINVDARVIVSPNITIAGQTAPGEGITIYGNGVSFSTANNSITRYVRIRMGKGGDSGKDAIAVADQAHDMIFDHITVSWGKDENFSVSSNTRERGPANITIQNSIIAQGLQTHSCGGLIQTDNGVSILRTLYIDNHTRNAKVKGKSQFINNVVYNWIVGAYIQGDSEGPSAVSVVGNYFIDGPETSSAAFTRPNANFHMFVNDNWQDKNRDGKLDGAELQRTAYGTATIQAKDYDYPAIKVRPAKDSLEYVLANAGASLKRDRVDAFVIEQLKTYGKAGMTISDENLPAPTIEQISVGKEVSKLRGTYGMGGPGPIAGGKAPVDTDRDGMADAWETANKLNPNDPADGKIVTASGYTNLENYLNSLVPVAN